MFEITGKNIFSKTMLIFIYIATYLCFFNQSIAGQTNAKNNPNINELQSKLDELNSSLTAINNEKDSGKTIEKKPEKEESKINPGEKKEKKNIPDTPKTEKVRTEEKEKTKSNDKSDKTLENEKKKTEWIIRTIDNGTHKDRKNAINQILTIKDQSLKNELGKKLVEVIKNEVEQEVKIKAISVAGEIKLKDASQYLIKSLTTDSDDICVAAVYAIKRIGDHSAKPALIAKLKEQKFETNTNLIEALIDTLGEFKAAELSGFASETIKNTKTNHIIRELLVIFLGKTESKESKDTLLELFKDEDENEQIRSFAVNSIANLKITEAIPDIEKVTQTIDSYSFNKKKKYYNLYIYCIAAMVKLGSEKAFPLFLNALRSDNAVVRLKAINILKEKKDKRTIDILKYKMNYDPSPKVQSAAKEALKELGVDIEAEKKDKAHSDLSKKYNSKKEDVNKKDTKDDLSAE